MLSLGQRCKFSDNLRVYIDIRFKIHEINEIKKCCVYHLLIGSNSRQTKVNFTLD